LPSYSRAEYIDAEPPEEWDTFLGDVSGSHPEQSSGWAFAERVHGWESAWILVREEGETVAGVQILHRKVAHVGRIAYIRCGPVFRKGQSKNCRKLFSALNHWAASSGVRYCVVNPGRATTECVTRLRQAGFMLKPEAVPPRILTDATLFIDLWEPSEQLLLGMRRERRREIRLASRSGMVFREGGANDLTVFYDLMRMTAARQGVAPIPANIDFVKALWSNLHPKANMRLFLVQLDDHPISAGVILPFSDTVRFWRYGWNGENAKQYPNTFLYWKMIQWSKVNGFRFFDIVQVDRALAEKLAANIPLSAFDRGHRMYGSTFFKMGFGGKVIPLAEPVCRLYPDCLNGIFRFLGPRICRLRFMRKWIR